MMTTELTHAEQNAQGWLETIREHVDCMNADRNRLEELRDERDGADDFAQWSLDNPEEAEELAQLVAEVTIDGEETDEDAIREQIEESPLSVQVRGGWHAPGETEDGPEEFEILISTGGPALRIIGELDEHCQPTRARLEHQDWGTPWTEFHAGDDYDALLQWASVFYFGE